MRLRDFLWLIAYSCLVLVVAAVVRVVMALRIQTKEVRSHLFIHLELDHAGDVESKE